MYCEKCGREIKNDAKFCVYCGVAVKAAEEVFAQQEVLNTTQPSIQLPKEVKEQTTRQRLYSDLATQNTRKRRMPVLAILGCVILVAGIVSAGVLLHNRNKEGESVMPDTGMETVEMVTEEMIETTDDLTEEETTQEEEAQVKIPEIQKLTKEDCAAIAGTLREKEVCDTDKRDTLLQMANVAAMAKIFNSKGDVFLKMSDEKKLKLDQSIVWAVGRDGIFNGLLEVETDWGCNISDVGALFEDVYGENEIPKEKSEIHALDKDKVYFEPVQGGDTWMHIYDGQIRQEGDYYLFTGPYFYGAMDLVYGEVFEGDVEILFVKNPESHFGVTMVYAKTYTKEIVSADTSSVLEPQEGKNYSALNLTDGKFETAWVEGTDGVGIGESVTLHLKNTMPVYGLSLYNGYLASNDLYDKNGKVTHVRIDFGNDVTREEEIPVFDFDTYGPDDFDIKTMFAYCIKLEEPVTTNKITITILDAKAGEKYDDTCISEIQVY